MKELRELFEGMTPIEVIGEIAGWAGLFLVLFMLSIIGG